MQLRPERSILLLPLNKQGALQLNVPANGTTAASFSENEVVKVHILSPLQNNTIRIAVKGVVMQVKALSAAMMQEGAFLLMRVHLSGNTVVLAPYRQQLLPYMPHGDVFTQLNIPQSELAAALITFLRQNEQPLEQKQLSKLLASLPALTPHEKKAAFIAVLLISHGIEPDTDIIAQYLQGMFGVSIPHHAGSDALQDEDDLFRLLNHIKTQRHHWVVFPFEKNVSVHWKGSAAFLLDIQNSCCLECCVRVHSEENRESWIFTLKNSECLFSYEGTAALSAQQQQDITRLLTDCLSDAGVSSYTVRPASGNEQHYSLESIDISV